MVGRSVADFLSLPIHRAATAEQEDARGNSREPPAFKLSGQVRDATNAERF